MLLNPLFTHKGLPESNDIFVLKEILLVLWSYIFISPFSVQKIIFCNSNESFPKLFKHVTLAPVFVLHNSVAVELEYSG